MRLEKESLPKGWIKTKLENVINLSNEKFNPASNENKTFIGLEHIEKNTMRIIEKGESKNLTSTKTKFRSGDILYGKLRPYLNKICIPDFNGVCSTDILVFSKNPYRSSKYIALLLSQSKFVRFANRNSTGVQHPRIKFDIMSQFQIPLPPLNEQKRIVQKIESILSQIDAGKKRLDNVKKLLKQAKQSISKLELVRLMKKYGLQQLDNICIKITDGSHNSPSNSHMGEIPYVTAKNIRPKKLDVTNITYITKKDHKEIFARCNPEKGDILYTKDGTVGYAVVNEYDFEFSLLSSVALLKPDHRILDSHYLENILNNPVMYNSVIEKMSGTALRRIILKKIKKIQIPLPPLNEQKRIVSKIESILGRIDANFVKTKMLTLIHDTI